MMTIFRMPKCKKTAKGGRLIEPLLLFLVFFFPGYLAGPGRTASINFGDSFFLLSYLGIALPQIALLLHMISRKGINGCARYGIGPPRFRDAVGALLLFACIFLFSSLFAMLSPEDSLLPWNVGSPSLFPLAIVVSFATGYREELFFRAYLIRELTDFLVDETSAPSWREITASSLLFSSGHIYQGWLPALSIFLISQLLGFWFIKRGRIHEVAIAHSLYNSMALLLLF
jgi:membrane protease YdiL (CAAX protease family)